MAQALEQAQRLSRQLHERTQLPRVKFPAPLRHRSRAALLPHIQAGFRARRHREEGQLLKSKTETKADGTPKTFPLLKYYTVFNATQIEGIEFPAVPSRTGTDFNPIATAEAVVAGFKGPTIEHGYNRACYSSSTDVLKMPSPGSFDSPEHYYATLFHELGHATGHASRMNRKLGNAFGSEDYSKEELIAEMTSAFLSAHCGIDNSTTEQSAAYLASWVKALKGDPKLVVTAASAAQRAANLILGAHPFEEEANAEKTTQLEEVAA